VELCRLIGLYLGKAGYSLTCSANGRDGVIEAISNAYDLVFPDVTLPVLDGFAVLHQVRRSSTIPIIMLTSTGVNIKGCAAAGMSHQLLCDLDVDTKRSQVGRK
jgi:DNA-binding response OmpR family regulator